MSDESIRRLIMHNQVKRGAHATAAAVGAPAPRRLEELTRDEALALLAGVPLGRIVVAYEADEIDPVTHLGWSVVVTGYARQVTDPGQLAHYNDTVAPWVEHTMDQAVRIRPDMVNGFRLTDPGQ